MTVSSSLFADPDRLSLGAHVRECDRAREPGFALYCLGERLHRVLRPRFVTTVLAAAAFVIVLASGL